jgi:hypothetical protein
MEPMGTPADIGNVVTLLCPEQAGWITVRMIQADGGFVDGCRFPLRFQRG